jgi:hypothetical protein
MVATVDMELLLLLRLQFFQHWGNFLWGDLQKQERRIGVQIEEYSIIFYLCICLCGNYCRKEKDLYLLHEANTCTLVHLQSDMNVEMDIRNQIFRYICRELKKLAEFLLKRLFVQ